MKNMLLIYKNKVGFEATKGNVTVFVESTGSQKNDLPDNLDEVFDQSQLMSHLSRQIHTLMRRASEYGDTNTIFVLANPDLDRIRKEYNEISPMIENLGFICMWVQEDHSVIVEDHERLKKAFIEL